MIPLNIPFSIALTKAYHAHTDILRPNAAKLGLSIGQPKLLLYLRRHAGCMQKDLAKFCGIEPATVSRILAKMERQGLIRREAVAANKRATAVYLTELGRELGRQVLEFRTQAEETGLRGFSAEERAAFYDYLIRFHTNLTIEEDHQ